MPGPDMEPDGSSGDFQKHVNPTSSPNDPEPRVEQRWPWETDETKRYPDKAAATLTEFERRYPPDQPGTELSDNSRLFRVYQDRVNELDEDTISGWSDAINFLLIFAGLFSAILTAFLLELSKKLEPDHAAYSSLSLFVLASNASGTNVTLPDDADPREFRAKATDRAINVLWFASLTLALLVSMLAILAKQWIGTFVSRMRMPVSHFRRWAHRHRAYRDGLDRWHLNAFVSGLSVLLHVALLLFLVGLVIYTYTLDRAIFIAVAVLSVSGVLIYLGSTLAPLVDGTCPTATPLLIHGHGFVFWALSRLGWYKMYTAPPFAEGRVVPDSSTGDVGVLSWILSNMASDQEMFAALDAVAELPRDALSEALATSEAVQLGTLHRLDRLVKGRRINDVESNAAELSRAIRSVLRSSVGPKNIEAAVQLAESVKTVRTHDVAILSRLLCIHAKGGPGLATYPPVADSKQHYDSYVLQLAYAFRSWTERDSQQLNIPVSRHNYDILYAFLSRFTLPTSFSISLLLTFGRDPDDSRRWIELVNLNVERDLGDAQFVDAGLRWDGGESRNNHRVRLSQLNRLEIPLGWSEDYMCRALHAWSSLFMAYNGHPKGVKPSFDELAARCCVLLLERWRFNDSSDAPVMPLQLLQTALAPLTSDVAATPGAILSALDLFMVAILNKSAVSQHWNASTAQILFHILERWRCHRPTPESLRKVGVQDIIPRVLASSLAGAHESLVLRVRSNTSAYAAVQRSMLNQLTPRNTRDGSRTSIWRLIVSFVARAELYFTGDEYDNYLVIFSEQLAALGMFNPTLDIGGMFEQLLGNEYGTNRILGADPSTTHAFDIMRHVASSAPLLWAELRPTLLVDRWHWHNDRYTPAALVAEAEAAPSCPECIDMAKQMREAHDEAAIRSAADEERLRQDNQSWFEQRVGCERG